MISEIYNQNFGYSVAIDSIWAAVGNPSLLRYNPLTSSITRTGSVEIFKYNINTDTHDKKVVLHRSMDNTEVVFLTTEYNTSSIIITPDSILHTEYTGTVPFTSDLDIIVDEGTYFTASEDGYGYSVDIKGDILAVGCPYFRSDFTPQNTQSNTFYGSGSVDIFDLTKLNIDPYAHRIPPELLEVVVINAPYYSAIVDVTAGQNFRYVFLQSKLSTDPDSSYITLVVGNTSNLGGILYLQTNYTNIIGVDFRVLGIVGNDPYATTIYNPNTAVSESFGYSVSLNDEWLAVGSPLESGSKGGVFLFQNGGSPDSWSLYQSISLPSEINFGDRFGHAVSLNKQSGSYSGSLVIGTLRPSGSFVYEYEFNGLNWNQRFTLRPDNITRYPLTFYPTLPLFSGSFPNTADAFGYDVDIFQDTIIVGAPTDRYIYEYSGSDLYRQGAVYFFERCPDPNKGYYLARKSYGNKNIMKNNFLGWSVGICNQYAVAGIPKINSESASICYLQGSLFQNNFCGESLEETLDGQYALYTKTEGTLPDTSFIDWDIVNVFQIRKKYLSPYRSFGWDIDISSQFIIVGSPMLIYGQNTVMSFFKEAPFDPPILSVSSGSVNLSWLYDYPYEEQDGFNLEKSLDGNIYSSLTVVANPDSRSYKDNAVSLNNTYWYKMNAYNDLGVSPYSNIVSIFLQPPPPGGPTILQVTTNSIDLQSIGTGSSILSWSFTDAFQTGFNIEKSSSAMIGFVNIDILNSGTSRSFADPAVDANSTYLYRVQPFNSFGTGSYSNIGSASFSNILYLSGSEFAYYNPVGAIVESNKSWKQIHGYKNIHLTSLDAHQNSLTSLTLISASALVVLSCSFNELTALDLSSCPSVQRLECTNNNLQSIDVGDCTPLFYLRCNNNLLTSLDVTNNPSLQTFNCYINQLSTLDLSQNPVLNFLNCDSNQLTTLDLSQNNPSDVSCNNNQLTNIDLSGNKSNLVYFTAQSNQLTSIDVSGLVSIDSLYLGNNKLTDLIPPPRSASMTVLDIGVNPWNNVGTPFDATQYPSLQFLYCSNTSCSVLDLSNSKNLISIQAFANDLSSLDFTACSHSLVVIDCSINPEFTTLDLSSCSVLQGFQCHENNMTSLLISGSSLTVAICYVNQLTTLDVSKCPNLIALSASINNFTSGSINDIYINLDNFGSSSGFISTDGRDSQVAYGAGLSARANLISKNWAITDNYVPFSYDPPTALISWHDTNGFDGPHDLPTFLSLVDTASVDTVLVGAGENGGDQITSLVGLQSFPVLTNVDADGNLLTSLDVTHTNLTILDCAYNSLTNIDVSTQTNLVHFHCHNNQLTNLNLFYNPALDVVDCSSNSITSLNITNSAVLTQLSCLSNSLASLDTTHNPALTELSCSFNNLTTLDISHNFVISNLDADHNNFTVDTVNNILSDLSINGVTGGAVSLEGQTPSAPPSVGPPDGIASKAALLGESPPWSVTTD